MSAWLSLNLDIVSDQERLWEETLADDPATELDARQGGLTPTNINPRLYHDIEVRLTRLIGKAEQLLGNATTNLAECWMHMRCKFDGGKVINRSQSGSWELRCMGAGLRQNLGREWGPKAWKQMTKTSPNKVYTDTAERSAKTLNQDRKRKNTEQAQERRRRSKYTRIEESDTTAARTAYNRHDGGVTPDEVTQDVSPERLEELKSSFYQINVVITQEQAQQIEEETRDQADNENWKYERRKRITASNAGEIAKMKKTTKRSTKVRNLLYTTFRGNAATRYGTAMEEIARNQYITYQRRNGHPDLEVNNCGLIISKRNNWLAATPDGLVEDPSDTSHQSGLVEIKNPYSFRDKGLHEACKASSFCLEVDKDTQLHLKHRHNFYFQVQCQLYCSDKEWCDFVVRTDVDMHIERIHRDRKWWGPQLGKLRIFYFTSLLPELACPQFRCGGIREPTKS